MCIHGKCQTGDVLTPSREAGEAMRAEIPGVSFAYVDAPFDNVIAGSVDVKGKTWWKAEDEEKTFQVASTCLIRKKMVRFSV